MTDSQNSREWIAENIEEARSVEWTKSDLTRILRPENIEGDHTHCIICWDALNPKITKTAYESSIGWLCQRCYDQYIRRNETT